MALFPTLSAQQETNRKILEDLQQKKQLLQKGVPTIVGNITSSPINQFLGLPLEVIPSGSGTTVSRSAFNPTSSTTLGFFIPQDSYYGNSFIPVLPRLEPVPPTKLSP